MRDFEHQLTLCLEETRRQALYRELRPIDSPPGARIDSQGKTLLNFSSNDYLGLANHPDLKTAAIAAVERYGAGSAASRLLCGSLAPHHQLEELLADFKGTAAALTFSSGYAAALGTICALLGKQDLVIIDRLVHACIVDAARLSGARLRVFAHNDPDDLEAILRWADRKFPRSASGDGGSKRLIVTESVFSMDGDLAPLRELVALKDKYGAWLMVDEAHATGLFGEQRRGLAEELGVSSAIEIQMGTLGKALGSSGGYICGPRVLIDYLINRARSFIFSTAPVPAAAAAAKAGICLAQSEEGRKRRNLLWQRLSELKTGNNSPKPVSAIVPVIIGKENRASEIAQALHQGGILLPAIRYPTVPRGQARLRITVTADHTPDDIETLNRGLLNFLPAASAKHAPAEI